MRPLKFLQCNKSGIFNIGTGKTLSFADVAKSVSETHGSEIITIPMPENLKASYQEYTCANMSKTNEALK